MGVAPTPRKTRAAGRAGEPAARPAGAGKTAAPRRGRGGEARPEGDGAGAAALVLAGVAARRDAAARHRRRRARRAGDADDWSLLIEHGGLLGAAGLRRAFGWAAIVPLALLAWSSNSFRPEPADDGAIISPRQRHLLGILILLRRSSGSCTCPPPTTGRATSRPRPQRPSGGRKGRAAASSVNDGRAARCGPAAGRRGGRPPWPSSRRDYHRARNRFRRLTLAQPRARHRRARAIPPDARPSPMTALAPQARLATPTTVAPPVAADDPDDAPIDQPVAGGPSPHGRGDRAPGRPRPALDEPVHAAGRRGGAIAPARRVSAAREDGAEPRTRCRRSPTCRSTTR